MRGGPDSPAGRSAAILGLAAVAILIVGYALVARVPAHKSRGFVSDEATYYSMAYSLALDGDLRYQRHDLERVYANGYGGGPTGLFLKRQPRTGRLYFAKSFAYPAAAAPFVRWFGDNGFLVLHSVLLVLMMAAGYRHLARGNRPGIAALYTATYLLAAVTFAYWFWFTPAWFLGAMAFLATFLWLYKLPLPGREGARRDGTRRDGWLRGPWTDGAAAALYAVVAFAKPPMIVLVGPLLADTFRRRRWRRAAALVAVFALVLVALFGTTWWVTGDWNYQGGDRRTFYFRYPLQDPAASFDSVGDPMVTEASDLLAPSLRPEDLLYVWIGRNTGILFYMFPAVLAVLLFVSRRRRRLLGPHGLLLASVIVYTGALLTLVSLNWIGGGGALGNRYLAGIYPVLFFLLPAGCRRLGAVTAWVVAGLFLAPILLSPMEAAGQPARHTKSFPYTLLPTELTILHQLPFNTSPWARRVRLEQGSGFFLYFLDENVYPPEPGLGGFWTKGRSTAEVVVRTVRRIDRVHLTLKNGPVDNRFRVFLAGERVEGSLTPGESVELELEAGRGFPYLDTFLYRLVVTSASGFVPRFHEPGNDDIRSLGLLVRPRVEPNPAGVRPY